MPTIRVAYQGIDRFGQHTVMVCSERYEPSNPGRSGSETLRFIDARDQDHSNRIASTLKRRGIVSLTKQL